MHWSERPCPVQGQFLITLSHEEWCRLGGVPPEFQKVWTRWIGGRSAHTPKTTKAMADAWVNEATG